MVTAVVCLYALPRRPVLPACKCFPTRACGASPERVRAEDGRVFEAPPPSRSGTVEGRFAGKAEAIRARLEPLLGRSCDSTAVAAACVA